MMDAEKLNALILRIYDAALDDSQWPLVVHELATLVNAEDSLLFGSPDAGNARMVALHAETFTLHDEQLIRQLIPHLQRSLLIRRQMAEERQMRQLREQALDQSKDAILLLDATGWILFANRKAEIMLQQGNPTVKHGRLSSRNVQENKALLHALLKAQQGIGSTLKFDDKSFPSGRVAMFSPVSATRSEQLGAFAHIMVIIAEPDKPVSDDLSAFVQLYRLTAAETRVLQHLLHQLDTKEIAGLLDISINTLRTHLKALFAKTRTKRELVKFCLSHPIFDR